MSLALLVTFKLPKPRACHYCYIHFLWIPSHCSSSLNLFSRDPCSFVLPLSTPFSPKGMVFPLFDDSLHCMNCLGLSILLHFFGYRLCASSFLSFPFSVMWVGFPRVLPFFPFLLPNPFSLNPFFIFWSSALALKIPDWAPDELLYECSLLNSVEDVEAHRGDPALYKFNAIC